MIQENTEIQPYHFLGKYKLNQIVNLNISQ